MKSIFAKYVITFTVLLLVSFLLLLFIVDSVVSNFSLRAGRRDTRGVAAACAENLGETYAASGSEDFRDFIQAGTATGAQGQGYIHRLLNAIMTNFEDMTVYVTDASGGFIFSTGKAADTAPPVGTAILSDEELAVLKGETESETETETETESESPTSSPRGTHNAGGEDGLSENVAEAAERFGSLAPASLFQQFEDCTPTGLEGSYECSGPEVGQVQFFDSQSKAASTTQLLTELRSSRVVEDTGRHVVGWSTLGTTAVITVVDNELGLVMQQLVSSDIVDPEERIEELGLVEDVAETTTAPSRDDAADAEFSNAEERREA